MLVHKFCSDELPLHPFISITKKVQELKLLCGYVVILISVTSKILDLMYYIEKSAKK